MNTILSFMDKLYSDSKTLSIVYVIGAVLLFIFIILLMVSLRKSDKKETTKIIEEPKIDDEPKEKIEETKVEPKETLKEEPTTINESINNKIDKDKNEQSLEQSIFEKTVIIPLDEIEKTVSREENIAQALDNVEKIESIVKEPEMKETTEENVQELSKDIPSVDDFVDNVVKRTYEKNEQFSSVFVGNNTSTIKLDKVMENLNVDEEVKESIVPEEERTEMPKTIESEMGVNYDPNIEKEIEVPNVLPEEVIETPKVVETEAEKTVSLDGLKKALEEKQKEVTLKQDDLKSKLEGLKKEQTKSNETMKAEDLLNKLNSMKEK